MRPYGVALTGRERRERPRLALGLLTVDADRYSPADDLEDGALADLMVAHFLTGLQVDDHRPAGGRGEENARLPLADRLDRGQMPAIHGGTVPGSAGRGFTEGESG